MYEGIVQDLIDELGRLPGVGPKSAQRIAFHILGEDPEDVKVIETEFKKLYDTDADFRNSFGEEAFDLDIMQKYSIIDAYNQGGMPAVLNLLS